MKSSHLSLTALLFGAAGNFVANVSSLPPLRLRQDGTFTMVQFADLHLGEGESSWGPGVDARTYQDLSRVIRAEPNVDLAVFSGDMMTGLNIDQNASLYWDRLMAVTDSLGIPHTAILGNHDAEPFSGTGKNQSSPGAHFTRLDIIEHDASLSLSHTQVGPAELSPAVSVYVVDVLDLDKEGEGANKIPALQLFHLDSGGGGMPEELHVEQVKWFNETIARRRASFNGTAVPALVFVHIPLFEFQDAIEDSGRCFGDFEDGITPTISNTGLFRALEAAPEVLAVFVGHDHCNDFCCTWGKERNVELCFGRHSGYGGYTCDGYPEGSRFIRFDSKTGVLETHVRLNKNLSVIHEGKIGQVGSVIGGQIIGGSDLKADGGSLTR